MTTVFENFSDHTAPPGHVTFSVLNKERSGHSVSVASKEYPGLVHATKIGLSNMDAGIVFEGAIKIIGQSAACTGKGCLCDDDGLLYAFVSALLKHPDNRSRRSLRESIGSSLKKHSGAHVILFMPPTGPSAWLFAEPSSNGQVQ